MVGNGRKGVKWGVDGENGEQWWVMVGMVGNGWNIHKQIFCIIKIIRKNFNMVRTSYRQV